MGKSYLFCKRFVPVDLYSNVVYVAVYVVVYVAVCVDVCVGDVVVYVAIHMLKLKRDYCFC